VSIDLPSIHDVSVQPVVPLVRQRPPLPGSFARQYQWGCWQVIEGTGDWDIQVVPMLRGLTVGAPLHVVFDLRRVTFIDASILGILVATRVDQGRGHSAVRLAEPYPMARKIIALTQLGSVLPSFETFDQAVAGHESC
jgi:anti-anti-sigma factor